MLRGLSFLLVTFIALLLITFCVVNRETIALNLFPLPYYADMPLFLFALICASLGVIAAGLTANIKLLGVKRKLRQEKRRAEKLEKELSALRSPTLSLSQQ